MELFWYLLTLSELSSHLSSIQRAKIEKTICYNFKHDTLERTYITQYMYSITMYILRWCAQSGKSRITRQSTVSIVYTIFPEKFHGPLSTMLGCFIIHGSPIFPKDNPKYTTQCWILHMKRFEFSKTYFGTRCCAQFGRMWARIPLDQTMSFTETIHSIVGYKVLTN